MATVLQEWPGELANITEACMPAHALEEIENVILQQSRVQRSSLVSSLTQQQSQQGGQRWVKLQEPSLLAMQCLC